MLEKHLKWISVKHTIDKWSVLSYLFLKTVSQYSCVLKQLRTKMQRKIGISTQKVILVLTCTFLISSIVYIVRNLMQDLKRIITDSCFSNTVFHLFFVFRFSIYFIYLVWIFSITFSTFNHIFLLTFSPPLFGSFKIKKHVAEERICL